MSFRNTPKIIEAFGMAKTTREWSQDKRCVVSLTVLKDRLRKTGNVEAAITTPIQTFRNKPIPEAPVENPTPSRTYVNSVIREPLVLGKWVPARAEADDHLNHRSLR